MELVGKVIQVLPPQEGVGRNGNPWKLQGYVLETLDQYPRKVHFEVFGEDRIKQNPCEIDQLVTISFDIESREFNGRWYTSIRAWRIQQGDMTQAAAPAPAAAPVAAAPAAAPAPAAQPAAQPAAPQAEVANVDPFDASAGDGTSDLPF
jgi:pyruvate/2-oxoglutarate dehydrogenase complex dihydrolipoamide acyltransferase (E2) component